MIDKREIRDGKTQGLSRAVGTAPREFKFVIGTVTVIFIFFFLLVNGCSQTDRVDKLIRELKDLNSDVRRKAAEALGKIKDPRAVEPLIAALKDKDPDPRRWAAWALGEIKDPRAVEALLTALKEKNLAVVAGAYEFFIRRGEAGSEPVLIEALNKYGDMGMALDFLKLRKPSTERGYTCLGR